MERNQTDCPVGHRAVSTGNGVICYTGTVIGSLAYTVCNGCQLSSSTTMNFSILECLSDGHWQERHLQLASTLIAKASNTIPILGILGALCFLVGFGTGTVSVAVIIYILKYKSKAKAEESVVYEYISQHRIKVEGSPANEHGPLPLPAPRVQVESNPAYEVSPLPLPLPSVQVKRNPAYELEERPLPLPAPCMQWCKLREIPHMNNNHAHPPNFHAWAATKKY